MTVKEPIKDFYGHILGYITTDTNTKNQIATNFYGKVLGKYIAKDNTTRDFYGKIITNGNSLAGLILQNNNK